MNNRKLLQLSVSILLGGAAAATLVPWPKAAETCVLGYRALCSFAPVSTVILLFAASTVFTLFKRKIEKGE